MIFKRLLANPFSSKKANNYLFKSFSTKNSTINSQRDFLNSIREEKVDSSTVSNELKAFHEYNEGTNYEHQGKFQQAHDQFKRILDILEMSNQKGSKAHLHILNKLFIIFI